MKEYCDHVWVYKTTPSGLVKVCCMCGAVFENENTAITQPEQDDE